MLLSNKQTAQRLKTYQERSHAFDIGGGANPTFTIVWAKYWGGPGPPAQSKTTPLIIDFK